MSDFRFAALTRWYSLEELQELSTLPTDDEIFNALKAERERVRELEASALTGYEDGWYTLRAERDGLNAKLAAVRGLPRFNVENGDPQMGGGYGPYRIKAVPKSQWINDGTFVRVKELEALLSKEQTK